jgi:hypothetical protein
MNSSWIEMAVYAISIFANDGTMDEHELDCLMGLATADGTIDADERRVLGRIFDRVDRKDVTERLWARIGNIRGQLGL